MKRHRALPNILLGAIAIMMLALAVAFGISSIKYKSVPVQLPKPEGAFQVGITSLDFTDSTRQEIYASDTSQKRKIRAYIWYPAKISAVDKRYDWIDATTLNALTASKLMDLSGAELVSANAYDQPAVAESTKPFPVLIMSHGDGAFPHGYTSLAEELASEGYVVVAISHSYNALATVLSDGTVIAPSREARAYMEGDEAPKGFEGSMKLWQKSQEIESIFAADICYVAEQVSVINERNPILRGRLDTERIGAFGHSLGGASSFEALLKSERIQAAVNMDGTIFCDTLTVEKPFLTLMPTYQKMQLPSDSEIEKTGWKKENMVSYYEMLDAAHRAFENSPHACLVTIEGAAHNNFTDMGLLTPAMPAMNDSLGTIDATYAIKIIRQTLTGFFQKTLKAENLNLSEILAPYPEVKVEQHGL